MDTIKNMNLNQALTSVQWKDISGDTCAGAIFCGSTVVPISLHSLTSPDDIIPTSSYIWHGAISECAGVYWIPQYLSGIEVQRAIQGSSWEFVRDNAKGLGLAAVEKLICCPMEIDHLTIAEQADKLDWLQAATGLDLAAVVMSGDGRVPGSKPGKSLHAYYSLAEDGLCAGNDEDRELWGKLQALLVGILRSDPSIQDVARRMRRPGGAGGGRYQTVLIAHPVCHKPAVLLAALERVAIAEGITDIKQAVQAIRWAHGLRKKAEGMGFEASTELQEIAARTLTARAISAADESLATAVVGKDKVGGSFGKPQGLGSHGLGKPERRTLPPAYSVTWQGGCDRLDRITRHQHCHCPEHGGSGKGSAFATKQGAGPFIHCASCGITWHCEDPNQFVLTPESVDIETPALVVAEDKPWRLIHQARLTGQQPTKRVTYIRSAQGTGKTYGMRDVVNQYERVLAISHRVSLVEKLCQDWHLVNYQTYHGNPVIQEARLGICVNSIRKVDTSKLGENPNGGFDFSNLNLEDVGYELVIIDESEQMVRQLIGDTIDPKDLAPLYRSLRAILHSAGHIICMDADLSGLTARFVRRCLGWDKAEWNKDEELIINTYKPRDRTLKMYDTLEDWMYVLRDTWALGKTCWVACDHKSTAERMSEILRKDVTARQVLTITADTRDMDDPVDLFTHPKNVTKWDAVVVSPAVSTGLSIDEIHIDSIFLCMEGGTVTGPDGLQMSYRVRHPKDTELNCFVTPRLDRKPVLKDAILASEQDKNERSEKILVKWDELEPGSWKPDPDGEQLMDLWLDITAYNRTWRNNLRRSIEIVAQERGLPVFWAPELDEDERRVQRTTNREIRKAMTLKRAEEIACSPLLKEDEYIALNRKGKINATDRAAMEKYAITEFYGLPVDTDLVLLDDRGHYRTAMRKYVAVELFEAGKLAELSAADVYSVKIGLGFNRTHYSNTARIISQVILPLFGIDGLGYQGVITLPDPKKWNALLKHKVLVEELLGATVPVYEKAPDYLSRVLRGIGLRKESTKGCGVPRVSKIYPKSQETAVTNSRARMQRVINRAGQTKTTIMNIDPVVTEIDTLIDSILG